MCEFCSNFKNKERKFRLFEVNPIPFFTPYRSRRMVYSSAESDKSSNALLKSKMSPNTSSELKGSSSYHSVVNSSINNYAGVTNEIRELLYAYQLLHLRTVLFLEGIHIKGIIINVSQNLVTVSGPNVEVTSNSTGNIIGYPNRINVKLESIQAIGDVE
ncbi:hypothetical protein [Bacillus wiedmannii]|uniref:hypothetical protein n=1 Tax=Bacillus wiedmannii TaxID=1890302 RepID=UPI003CF562E1